MQERVAEVICRYSMFRPGDRVGVAVSGGADSTALLYLLVELAPRWNLALRVLHVDHRLRGRESAEDARVVAGLASSLGLEFELLEADVRELARLSGENLEQTARRVRLDFFRGLVTRGTVDRVALGHTRSDQAETVLFRLLRGSGIAGLAGIWPVTEEGLVRPLLEVDREDVRRYLEHRGIRWREDSTNLDMRLARNRIRRWLLPELEREWNPELVAALARLAAMAQAEERHWREETDRVAARELTWEGGALLMRCSRLTKLPKAVARRLVRRAIEEVKGSTRRVDFEHVERILDLAGRLEGRGEVSLSGVEVKRSFDWLRLAAGEAAGVREYRISLAVPGRWVIPGTRRSISVEVAEWEQGYNTGGERHLDWGLKSAGLELRSWRAGDAFRAAGRAQAEKMKDLFQQARIPSWERPRWPMITIGGTIVWTRRFGVAEGFAPRQGARQTLRIAESEEEGGG